MLISVAQMNLLQMRKGVDFRNVKCITSSRLAKMSYREGCEVDLKEVVSHFINGLVSFYSRLDMRLFECPSSNRLVLLIRAQRQLQACLQRKA